MSVLHVSLACMHACMARHMHGVAHAWYRSPTCLLPLEPSSDATSAHFLTPCASTSLRKRWSSCHRAGLCTCAEDVETALDGKPCHARSLRMEALYDVSPRETIWKTTAWHCSVLQCQGAAARQCQGTVAHAAPSEQCSAALIARCAQGVERRRIGANELLVGRHSPCTS